MEFVFDNDRPIYIQLVEQLRLFILSGKLNEGEKLPSVRDLAMMAKVNPNTMQKALVELEDVKLIYTERTNGKFVTEDKKLLKKFREELALDKVKTFIDDMKFIGFSKEEMIEYLCKIG